MGSLNIIQRFENNHCLITVTQIEPQTGRNNKLPNPDIAKSRYTFRSDGYIEVFQAESVQEIQLLNPKKPLEFNISQGLVHIQLPSGQKLALGPSSDGKSGLVRSFTGFSAAQETNESGLQLTPSGSESLLISPRIQGDYPHRKTTPIFALVTAEGKQESYSGKQIYNSTRHIDLPQFRSDFSPSSGSKSPSLKAAKEDAAVSNATEKSQEKTPSLETISTISEPTEQPDQLYLGTPGKYSELRYPPGPPPTNLTASPTPKVARDIHKCVIGDLNTTELNAEYLKVQGELSLSRLAYYYLKDSGETTEKLEDKIKNLLQSNNLKAHQELIAKKITLNSALITLKNKILEDQKKWKSKETEDFQLQDIDFKYFSLASELEKNGTTKSNVINFVRMIDSSYRNSVNSKDEKFRALDKRFQLLSDRRTKILADLKTIRGKCVLEASTGCVDCLLKDPKDNMNELKQILQTHDHLKNIEWGSFWLHTGRKGK